MLGLGQFGGYVSAQHDLRLLFPALCGHMESRFHALMALAAAVITVCVLITAICIREPSRPPAAEQEEQQAGWRVMAASSKVRRLGCAVALGWLALFPFLIFVSSWMALDVFGGGER